MNLGDKKFGFFVKEINTVAELSATMLVMEHEGTGARLVYLDREDENKTFAVAFKTLPTDSTGVFHILEHSVFPAPGAGAFRKGNKPQIRLQGL